MDTDEFMNWLADELRKLVQIPPSIHRSEAAEDIISRAINILMDLPESDRNKIIEEIRHEDKLGTIADYHLPFDIRDDIDIIGAVLSTLEGLE